MEKINRLNSFYRQAGGDVFTPSWLSGLIAVASGLIMVVGVIVAFSFSNSQVQQQLVALQNTTVPALTQPGQNPPGNDARSLQNTWPLIAIWAVVGLVVYFVVEAIVNAVRSVTELRQQLDYVHAERNALLRVTVESLVIRLLAAVLWLVFIELFLKRIIPYSITAAHASASDLHSLNAALYALLSFAMVALSLHLHAIFLRLLVRKPRVFSAR